MSEVHLRQLAEGPLCWFRDWPDAAVPTACVGSYTIWDADGRFIYVGMAGRNIKEGRAVVRKGPQGLFERLTTHFHGRRSGDQFSVYVADRFVLATLMPQDISEISSGRHSLDAHIRKFIHAHFGYRYSVCASPAEAREIENKIRRGDWPYGRPILNPEREA